MQHIWLTQGDKPTIVRHQPALHVKVYPCLQDRVLATVAINTDPRGGRVLSEEAQARDRRFRYDKRRRDGLVRAGTRVEYRSSPVRAVLGVRHVRTNDIPVRVEHAVKRARLVRSGLAALVALLERRAREDGRGEEDVGEESSDEHCELLE